MLNKNLLFLLTISTQLLYTAPELPKPTEGTDVIDFSKFTEQGTKNATVAFHELIQGSKPVIIKFFMEGCGPCMSTIEGFAKLAKKFGHKARFVTLDVLKYEEIANKYTLESVPTFGIFLAKRLLLLQKGSRNLPKVEVALKQLMLKK